MSQEFDAYHKWLGIPPAEQPPNHYRLLGISLFESDPDVIDAAADQRMAHVRTYQLGAHSAKSQELLNQISAARLCLLSEPRRKEYDDLLRRALSKEVKEPASVVTIVADERLSRAPRPKAGHMAGDARRWWPLAAGLGLCILSVAWFATKRRAANPPPRPEASPRKAESRQDTKARQSPRESAKADAETTRQASPPTKNPAASERQPRMVDADRGAATWVLKVGGSLTVAAGGESRQVAALSDLPSAPFEVWSLNLSGRKEVDDAGLACLSSLRHVRSIDLSGTEIGDDALRHVRTLISLEHLGLGATRITNSGLSAVASLDRLRSLGVNFTQVTGAGLSAISGLQELRALDVSAVKLGDGGLENIVKLSRLESLTLNFGDITNEQLSMLTRLPRLANLDLLGTSITDAGLQRLAQMGQLKRLSLEKTAVSEAAVKQLQEALHQCQILR